MLLDTSSTVLYSHVQHELIFVLGVVDVNFRAFGFIPSEIVSYFATELCWYRIPNIIHVVRT